MSKRFKTTDTNVEVNTSTSLIVEIGMFIFEVDERYPWVNVYIMDGEDKEFVTQIDGEDEVYVEHEELERFALNWYFNNVEIVSEIEEEN